MYLEKGEIFTVKQLLQGLLIHSSNDAAEVLAEYVSGNKADFAKLMNKEAKINFINKIFYYLLFI